MKISGFTLVRNAIKFDYPIVESIRSILPVCDEVVVAVGNSDDGTRELITSIGSEKIRIIDTIWDESLREGGAVLAVETNKAFDAISPDADWAFYIQGDEVFHESQCQEAIREMEKWKDDPETEGLLFNYYHFYGSYDYIGDSRRWYRNEVRIIRNDKRIRSYRDAQGFRIENRPLKVRKTDLNMYHYGWVRPPEIFKEKLSYFNTLWHDEKWLEKNKPQIESFDYSEIDSLQSFKGTHPAVMNDRIAKHNWIFSFDPTRKKFSCLSRILYQIEKKTGFRVGEYKNFKILR
ncbi:MAG: glycosyltransferase family 2 protein [Bacteroidota bacterium]|nr:glycosyltransferase family 2 protein [Bacteroidota bacterium]